MSTERASFGEVAEPHLPWLYSLARRLVSDPEASEDLVQKALLKAYRAYGQLQDVQAFPAWLRAILVNCCRDHLRSVGRGPNEEPLEDLEGLEGYSLYRTLAIEDPLPYSDSLHLDFLSTFEIADVWAVLGRLKPLYRAPLVLVHMEGYTTREVADMFDVPQNTVLSWLHRGRKSFERELWTYAQERGLLRRLEGAAP
ncbi:MAG: RNA polymerase sigma factor [Actinobacteria bacterium]|nr:RNA polymerase sigma factor [Actinomycetota bacterium]